MNNKVTTYSTLRSLVDFDTKNHKLKYIADLFLNAMRDWPTYNQTNISDFIKELEKYFGIPITIESIISKKFNKQNAWQIEAGSSIIELIDKSSKFCNESNFQNIFENILIYYEEEFSKVDFIAELKYLTTEQGGRITPAITGYSPQVKFDFSVKQTSGKQTFIDKEIVYPGESVRAKIKILSGEYFANTLNEEMNFEIREGAKITGTGKIKVIINDKLKNEKG